MRRILIMILLCTFAFSIIGCSAPHEGVSTASSQEPKVMNDSVKIKSAQKEASSAKDENSIVECDDFSDVNESSNYSLVQAPNSSTGNEIDIAVGNAVISANEGSFLEGEVKAEGHIILQESSSSDDSKIVYAITMYGEYGFQNDALIKISGTGAVPAVLTFGYSKDTGYVLKSYSVPDDGSGYLDSVKEMFPKDLYNYVLSVSDSDLSNLQAQERKYAKAYLNKMGRSAVIGDYSDINHEFPQISDKASNEIFKRYWEYPDWIGTEEKIENGVRYVYETQWKNYGNDDSMIYFSKYVYSTGEIIKTINVSIEDGVIQSSEEKVKRIIENSSDKPLPSSD